MRKKRRAGLMYSKVEVRYLVLLLAAVAIPAYFFYRRTVFPSSGAEDQENAIDPVLEQRVAEEVAKQVQSMNMDAKKVYLPVKDLPQSQRRRILVTGGAGFVGSHLVDRLMTQGHEVIVVDNMFTGSRRNVQHWIGHPNFQLIIHDVVEPILLEVDQIYHLACPASPPHYQYNPVKTIKTSTMGTINMLGLAKRVRARMLFTSTSEIYGDPLESPQKETYWGNVNPIGPRACYDEGKRVAETLMYAYKAQAGIDVRVARIFNTFGPRMNPTDGRVVSNFIMQALQGKDLTIYGDGKTTRSFQYVDDLVDGLMALMASDYDLPVNIGNPDEYTIQKFAELIVSLTDSKSPIVHLPATTDDPKQRRPDITVAMQQLKWKPKVSVKEGLHRTIEYFKEVLERTGEIETPGPGQYAAVVGGGGLDRAAAPPGALSPLADGDDDDLAVPHGRSAGRAVAGGGGFSPPPGAGQGKREGKSVEGVSPFSAGAAGDKAAAGGAGAALLGEELPEVGKGGRGAVGGQRAAAAGGGEVEAEGKKFAAAKRLVQVEIDGVAPAGKKDAAPAAAGSGRPEPAASKGRAVPVDDGEEEAVEGDEQVVASAPPPAGKGAGAQAVGQGADDIRRGEPGLTKAKAAAAGVVEERAGGGGKGGRVSLDQSA